MAAAPASPTESSRPAAHLPKSPGNVAAQTLKLQTLSAVRTPPSPSPRPASPGFLPPLPASIGTTRPQSPLQFFRRAQISPAYPTSQKTSSCRLAATNPDRPAGFPPRSAPLGWTCSPALPAAAAAALSSANPAHAHLSAPPAPPNSRWSGSFPSPWHQAPPNTRRLFAPPASASRVKNVSRSVQTRLPDPAACLPVRLACLPR